MGDKLSTYDAKQVKVLFGGIPLGGYAAGTFVTIERVSDAWEDESGADGETVRIKSNDKRATMTLTLLQTSDSNDVLSASANLDELSNGGVVPVAVSEINSTTTVFSGKAWVKKQANIEYGKEISNREWVISMVESKILVGSNVNLFS